MGWNRTQRERHLPLTLSNSRFLILPWVQVTHLASKVLCMAHRDLPDLWEERHGTRPILCETFVDPTQCDGACDKAANGQHIGATAGQGKTKPAKDITVTPFDPHFRAFLKGKKKPLSTRNRQKAKRTALREDPPFTALWSRMIDAATRMAHHHLDRHALYLPSRPLGRTSWHDNRGG